jgi:hypothetical protein
VSGGTTDAPPRRDKETQHRFNFLTLFEQRARLPLLLERRLRLGRARLGLADLAQSISRARLDVRRLAARGVGVGGGRSGGGLRSGGGFAQRLELVLLLLKLVLLL